MTPKQERFVAEYLIDGNVTRAAVVAGYSLKTAASIGSENLTKPEIIEAVRQGKTRILAKVEARAVRRVASKRELQELWTEVAEDPAQEMPSRLRATQLLGLSEAYFTERQEFSGPAGAPIEVQHDFSALTEEQKLAFAKLRALVK